MSIECSPEIAGNSDHFDGRRFFKPAGTRDPTFSELRRMLRIRTTLVHETHSHESGRSSARSYRPCRAAVHSLSLRDFSAHRRGNCAGMTKGKAGMTESGLSPSLRGCSALLNCGDRGIRAELREFLADRQCLLKHQRQTVDVIEPHFPALIKTHMPRTVVHDH